jgi:D-glycero-D-manno-heptose 1,7-bisphosphate phosphatase
MITNAARRFVLLDRDGTINVDHHYLARPEQIELLPEAARGLRHLHTLGFSLAVITNQSAIGRGYFDETRLTQIHLRFTELLAAENVSLDGIFFCPHTPDDDCSCRKPSTGLVEQAAQQLNFDPHNTIVIGDKPCDIELAHNLGVPGILVKTGYGKDYPLNTSIQPACIADNLYHASLLIQDMVTEEFIAPPDRIYSKQIYSK